MNFEHKIFAKQEGLIKKIPNHSQKRKETKLKFDKRKQNRCFWRTFLFQETIKTTFQKHSKCHQRLKDWKQSTRKLFKLLIQHEWKLEQKRASTCTKLSKSNQRALRNWPRSQERNTFKITKKKLSKSKKRYKATKWCKAKQVDQ